MIVRLVLGAILVLASLLYIAYAIGNPSAARDAGLPSAYIALIVSLGVARWGDRRHRHRGP